MIVLLTIFCELLGREGGGGSMSEDESEQDDEQYCLTIGHLVLNCFDDV